jgi:hypothetical protein
MLSRSVASVSLDRLWFSEVWLYKGVGCDNTLLIERVLLLAELNRLVRISTVDVDCPGGRDIRRSLTF